MRCLFLAGVCAVAVPAQSWSLSDFGRPCGGDLSASLQTTRRGVELNFTVQGAAPDAVAILVLGQQAPAPIALPGSACSLLVDARHTLFTTTDRTGQAGFALTFPNVAPVVVDFQVVIAMPTRIGRLVEATDGVRLSSR